MDGRLTRSTPGWVGGLNTRDACRPIVYHMAYGSYSTVHVQVQYSIQKRALLTLGAPLYHATKCTRQSICTRCSTVRYSTVQYSTVQYSTSHGFCISIHILPGIRRHGFFCTGLEFRGLACLSEVVMLRCLLQ